VKGGMTFERPDIGREQAEADRAAPVAVVRTVVDGFNLLGVNVARALIYPSIVMAEGILLEIQGLIPL
jgi:hypothetical protein